MFLGSTRCGGLPGPGSLASRKMLELNPLRIDPLHMRFVFLVGPLAGKIPRGNNGCKNLWWRASPCRQSSLPALPVSHAVEHAPPLSGWCTRKRPNTTQQNRDPANTPVLIVDTTGFQVSGFIVAKTVP